MRAFLALAKKEFRDLRLQLALGLGAAFVVSFAFRHFLLGWLPGRGETAAVALTAVLAALFAAAAAADAVAGDVATRRIESLAALPVTLADVWIAKATVVLATMLAAGALLVAWSGALVAYGVPEDVGAFGDALVRGAPWFAAAFALGCATLFFSTLLERGFAAFLGAAATLVGLAALVEFADLPCGSFASSAALKVVLFGFAGVAFLVASRTAFVHGGLHVGRKARPAILGFGLATALFAPAFFAVPAWAHADETTSLDGFLDGFSSKSPDGKWTAGESRRGTVCAVWIADAAGARRVVASGAVELARVDAWTPESNLRFYAAKFTWVAAGLAGEETIVEPSRLGVVETKRVLLDPATFGGR